MNIRILLPISHTFQPIIPLGSSPLAPRWLRGYFLSLSKLLRNLNRNKTRCASLNRIGSYATLEQRRNKRLSDQAERPMPNKSFFSWSKNGNYRKIDRAQPKQVFIKKSFTNVNSSHILHTCFTNVVESNKSSFKSNLFRYRFREGMMIKGRTVGIFYSMSMTVALVFAALNAAGVTTVKENSYSIATIDENSYKVAALQKSLALTETEVHWYFSQNSNKRADAMFEWIFLHIASALLLVAFSLRYNPCAPAVGCAHFIRTTDTGSGLFPIYPCCPERRYGLYSCTNTLNIKKLTKWLT